MHHLSCDEQTCILDFRCILPCLYFGRLWENMLQSHKKISICSRVGESQVSKVDSEHLQQTHVHELLVLSGGVDLGYQA